MEFTAGIITGAVIAFALAAIIETMLRGPEDPPNG
jgi:hypothetical protein